MNILMLTDEPPSHVRDGNPSRYFHLFRCLSESHHITLLCISRSEKDRQSIPEMLDAYPKIKANGSVIETVNTGRSKWVYLFHCLGALFRGEPIQNGYFTTRKLRRRIVELCHERHFDVVHVEQSHMAPYIRTIRKSDVSRSVLFLHNIGPVLFKMIHEIEDRPMRKVEYKLNAFFSKRWEPRICECFDRCLFYSDNDKRNYLVTAKATNASVVPIGAHFEAREPLPPPDEKGEILFIGKMTYPPNRDAVRYFSEHVLPLILEKRGQTKFNVVGHPAPEGLEEFAPREVLNITGFVDDLQDMYRRCSVSVVPLRAGSGVKMKILESMTFGRPVVSTTLGCEGMNVTHGEDIWIADTPADFAEGVLRLMSDEALWKKISDNGRRYVEEHHGYQMVARGLSEIYQSLLSAEGT